MEKQRENKEIERKLMELSTLENRIRELQQQFASVEQQISEMQMLKLNLDDITKSKKEKTKMLAHLGGNIFVKGQLEDTKEVFVNLGAKTVVKKSIEEAKGIIDKKIKSFEEIKKVLEENMNEVVKEATKIEKELS